jgi:hypothetical protein
MRTILLIAVGALLIPVNARSQQQSGTSGFGCFENLEPPEYPRSAVQERVNGSVWTTVQATPQGTPDIVSTTVVSAWANGSKLLTPPVDKAVRAAKVKPECVGKTISVVFRYQVDGDPVANPKVTSRIDAPEMMTIESEPFSRSGP